MDELMACRICLNTDVKLFDMYKYQLTQAYESVMDEKLKIQDHCPKYICSYCSALLLKYFAFKDKCVRAQEVFESLFNGQHMILTKNNFKNICRKDFTLPYEISKQLTSIECTHIEDDVKIEIKDIIDYTDTIDTDFKYDGTSDDEPLIKKVSKKECDDFADSTIKTEIDLQGTEGTEEWMDNEVDIILLTKEQQIEDIQSRRSSVNYLNSAYKCDKCYKGFITESTYKNHMERHDPSLGPHVCDVCFTRWPELRALRSHVVASHERRYLCRRCNFVSKSSHQAKDHNNWHKGVVYNCRICGVSFKKPTSHLTHMRLQHPSNHSCDVCGESFIGKYGLNLHKKKKHKNVQLDKNGHKMKLPEQTSCTKCNTKFSSSAALKRHVDTSDNSCTQNQRPCVHCGESFPDDETLKIHARGHSGDRIFTCEGCNKTFANEKTCAVHYRRIHLGIKVKHRNYNSAESICEICGKKCITKATLINHLRTHTGEKPHGCSVCHKRFSTVQHLQIHFRTHTDERPFKCSSCPKAFRQKAALNRHNRVHTGAKPYNCPHCEKAFSQSNSMKVHIRTVHLKLPAPYRNRRNKE